jgi:hypothetical protein
MEKIMTLIGLFVTIVVVGVVLYLVNMYIPMDSKIKQFLNIAVLIFLVLWVLKAFGVLGSMGAMHL